MPKREAPVPWRIGKAGQREPYPRKNVYFVGRGMAEVYNYCVWQAHIDGHITLAGKKARGVSALIVDILSRRYLDAMVDPEKLASFTEWCETQQLPRPNPVVLAIRKILQLLPKRPQMPGTLNDWKLSSEYRELDRLCKALNNQHRDPSAERNEEAS